MVSSRSFHLVFNMDYTYLLAFVLFEQLWYAPDPKYAAIVAVVLGLFEMILLHCFIMHHPTLS